MELIAKHFTAIMMTLGMDLEDDCLKDTPKRVRISPTYSKSGEPLISLSLIGDPSNANQKELQENVINELKFWYPEAAGWKHLKSYQIDYALPYDDHVTNEPDYEALRLNAQTFVCRDHLINGSIYAAIKSGRLPAEAIIKSML